MDAREALSRATNPDVWATLDKVPANEREKESLDNARAFFMEEAAHLIARIAGMGYVVSAVNEPIVSGKMQIELEEEVDGRWIAEIRAVPGAMAYGATAEEAVTNALAIAKDSFMGGADGP